MSGVDLAVRQAKAITTVRVKDLIITARAKDLTITARVKDLVTSDRACRRCTHEKGDAEHATKGCCRDPRDVSMWIEIITDAAST